MPKPSVPPKKPRFRVHKTVNEENLPTKTYLKGSTAALVEDESIAVQDIAGSSALERAETFKTLYLKRFPEYKTDLPKPTTCSFLNCSGSFEHGAHVRFEARGKYYVIPSCHEHNKPRSAERRTLKAAVLAIKHKIL